ncbi:arginine--tRNA ligase [Anaerobacillus alkaliphilus]|uniref:Arginine--tRNA ligase n=1 Tax=Anaerobacillus alkaliphilus TaxID=1548597 RepID=A0A4V1LFW0_9BACI|nr:arginine--tRNA ligase [Anaerobacillus alkaliphilus]RXI96659.1 arginine--tRNA ligase [Anaerobacillus alkaliphilus]
MELKLVYATELTGSLDGMVEVEDVEKLIEKPKYEEQGDLAFPCFGLAKLMKKAPNVIAKELAPKIQHPLFEKVVADGPYVNCFLNKQSVSNEMLQTILNEDMNYGSLTIGNKKSIVLDFSSPNIAKPFSMGHLRSTVIGNSLANIVEKCGYQAVRVNHLGDWGTQFGKLIVAYQLWGDANKVKAEPIKELLALYVKFHEEAEKQPALEDEARRWFKKLEDGNEEALALWKWFREESLQEFSKIYQLLDVHFDSYQGEAFYNDKMDQTIELLNEKGLLSSSEGAEVVDLHEYDLPPCLIKKSDGATLYATRDVTAAFYRQQQYQFEKTIYVVGQEQSLHFKQVFLVLEKAGFEWAKQLVHIPFGFILKDGKKMSTRKGKIVLLEEVITEAIELAHRNIEAKNPNLANKAEIAKMVGVGSIIFHDLKNERQNNVEFSLEEMLKFEGTTGPYVQYTHARACSILRKAAVSSQTAGLTGLQDSASWAVVKLLMEFPNVIEKSFYQYEPSQVAKYLLDLSQEFNKYYSRVKILTTDEELESRLALVKSVTIVLKEGLRLLGVHAPKEM